MAQDPRALLQQAQKAASNAGSGFAFFGGREEKYEHAAELYNQAGNAFRLQKQGKEAGLAYERAANIQIKNLSDPDEAANTFGEAFKAYRKTDPEEAARCLNVAIQHYVSKGNFRRAATNQEKLAELYEVELIDNKRALAAYDTAAAWYESDNAEALANKWLIKVADLSAEELDYSRSVDNYEKVAKSSMNNNLMRWSVKEYLLKAGICHLASGDMVATKRALDSYIEIDPSFSQTREYRLIHDLVIAVEQHDQENFSDKLFQFDQMSKLDKWKTKILLRVKDGIENAEDDFA